MPKHLGISGRVATQADVDANDCMFFVPDGRSVPYSFGVDLPLAAIVTKLDDGDGFPPPWTEVSIVQAELVDEEDVLLGILYGEEEGVCSLADIELRR